MKRFRALGSGIAALAALSISSAAMAGYTYREGVATWQSGSAWGEVGTARYSTDSNEDIGCETGGGAGGAPWAYCWAADATGKYASCTTSDANLVQIAGRVNTTSYIQFYYASNGSCSSIYVQNGSEYIY